MQLLYTTILREYHYGQVIRRRYIRFKESVRAYLATATQRKKENVGAWHTQGRKDEPRQSYKDSLEEYKRANTTSRTSVQTKLRD
jgi:hypothetical protein